MEIGLNIRKEVITTSLIIESLISSFLGELLGIKDIKNSKLFGNKGGCLSFSQKVDMLIDIGVVPQDDRKKFQAFMEIRNQFMHNLEAINYEKCLSFTNGTDKFLLKAYPQITTLSKEEQLKAASQKLNTDIAGITKKIITKILEKFNTEAETNFAKRSEQAFIAAIIEVKDSLDDFFNKEIEKSSTFDTARLKGFGSAISKKILESWKEKIDEETLKKIEP